jgi:hypothetical protein
MTRVQRLIALIIDWTPGQKKRRYEKEVRSLINTGISEIVATRHRLAIMQNAIAVLKAESDKLAAEEEANHGSKD